MSDNQLYNLEQLEAMASGDVAFVNKMVGMFIDLTPEVIDRMKDGFASDDLEDMGAAAHKIKPSIDMMGIKVLYQKIRDLEQFGKNRQNMDQIPGLLNEVVSTLEAVIEQLKAR